jgi:hypothetical protein
MAEKKRCPGTIVTIGKCLFQTLWTIFLRIKVLKYPGLSGSIAGLRKGNGVGGGVPDTKHSFVYS